MPRQYTDAQLAEIAKPFEEHAIDALRAGDLGRVRELLGDMARGNAGLDALTGHTLARKVGKLRQDVGEAQALALLRRIGARMMHTWVDQFRAGDDRGAIIDLIAVFLHQGGSKLAISETDDAVVVELAPCGSGGRLERQGMTSKYPVWYAGWSDGVSSYCQVCKACQGALNDALGAGGDDGGAGIDGAADTDGGAATDRGPVWTTDKGDGGHCTMRIRKPSHPGQRIFSEEDLVELGRTRVQRIEARLDAGDTAVEDLLRGQRFDWKPWHDFGVVMLEYFYATALEVGGPDYLDEMLMQTYAPAFEVGFPRYAAMTDDELVREIARTWNYHCATFTIREEDDRFVFVLDPCGSGGRMFRGQMWRNMFHYGEPMSVLIPQAHDIDFNRAGAPAYCTHCAASNRAQFAGGPLFFVIDGHAQMRPGQPCRQFSYKKAATRENVDPALPAQIGMPPFRKASAQ